MKKSMKIIIMLSAILCSLLCIVGGLASRQASGLLCVVAGGVILLAIIAWPLVSRIVARAQKIQRIGLILTRSIGIGLLVIQLICVMFGIIRGRILEGFQIWTLIAMTLGGLIIISAFFIFPYIIIKLKMAYPYQMMALILVIGLIAITSILVPWDAVNIETPTSMSYWGFILAVVLISAAQFLHPTTMQGKGAKPIMASIYAFPYVVLSCSWAVLEAYTYWIFLLKDNAPWYEKLLVAIPDAAIVIVSLFILPYFVYIYLLDGGEGQNTQEQAPNTSSI